MDERDIFDEEYDRINGQHNDFNSTFNSWSNYNATPQQPKQNKSLRIVLTAVLMVFCLVFGWALGSVTTTSSGDDVRKDVLNSVIDFMDYNFYQDIDDETWQNAVEQAGIALLQYAGDKFTFLMSPQSYYDYIYGSTTTSTAASNMNELFGMSYTMDDKGMVISSVVTDSVSYGCLYEGDLVVKLTDIMEYDYITDKNGNVKVDKNGSLLVKRDEYGTAIPKEAEEYSDGYVMEGKTTTEVGNYLIKVYSANFHILRDGEIKKIALTRSAYGIKEGTTANKRYDFNYVEYYFSDEATNISIKNLNGAATNTKTERGLDNLPKDIGYIHLTQFEDKAYSEMQTALELFRDSKCTKLILDLKDNPGGSVKAAVEIAGLFIDPENLSASDLKKVTRSANCVDGYSTGYLITTLTYRDGNSDLFKINSSYRDYFSKDADLNDKKRIIVWTDGGSASASEMLTGTLLDYGTAVHMGTKSYGKGIAQKIEELDITGTCIDKYGEVITKPWAVYYTCAKYYSPLGKNIHGVGYTPNENYIASSYTDLRNLAENYWGGVR